MVNLLALLLITTTAHKVLLSLDRYGFELARIYNELVASQYLNRIENYQTVAALLCLPAFTGVSFWLEILASTRFPRVPLFILIALNLIGLLVFPVVISIRLESHPGIASYLLLFATTTFLKLVSFHHVYHDVRYLVKQVIAAKRSERVLEPSMCEGTIFGVSKSVYDVAVTYPKCLTAENFLRYMIAPTCCY